MAITQRDVKIVYDDPPDQVVATPQGTSLSAPIGSGVPAFQGVANAQPDLVLDFADGTSNITLGINLAGEQVSNGQLPYRKHSYSPTAGEGGTGAIVMDWFTGMNIQFSPVWVEMPGGFTPHYRFDVRIKQTASIVHPGSAPKVFRQIHNNNYELGTLLWSQSNLGNGSLQRWTIAYDYWESAASGFSNSLCAWDTVAATDKNCGFPPENKVDGFLDGNFHTWGMECDSNDPENASMSFYFDGLLVRKQTIGPLSQATIRDPGNWYPNLGDRVDISPFFEMVSCGPSGCESGINTGQFIVSQYSFTILP